VALRRFEPGQCEGAFDLYGHATIVVTFDLTGTYLVVTASCSVSDPGQCRAVQEAWLSLRRVAVPASVNEAAIGDLYVLTIWPLPVTTSSPLVR
jgi:hypothetical protein